MTDLTYDPERVNNLENDLDIPFSIINAKITPLAFSVVTRMLLFADFKTGQLSIGQKCLADLANVSKRIIPKAVDELLNAGIIRIDKKGTGRNSTHYTIICMSPAL